MKRDASKSFEHGLRPQGALKKKQQQQQRRQTFDPFAKL